MRKNIEIPSDIDNLRIIEKVIDDMSWELNLSDEIYGNVISTTIDGIILKNELEKEKIETSP